eukprot:Gb_29094 [translate_table: standard]
MKIEESPLTRYLVKNLQPLNPMRPENNSDFLCVFEGKLPTILSVQRAVYATGSSVAHKYGICSIARSTSCAVASSVHTGRLAIRNRHLVCGCYSCPLRECTLWAGLFLNVSAAYCSQLVEPTYLCIGQKRHLWIPHTLIQFNAGDCVWCWACFSDAEMAIHFPVEIQ